MRMICRSSLMVALWVAAGAVMPIQQAQAAGPTRAAASQQGCLDSSQDPRACRRESGAAAQAVRKGTLTTANPTTYEQNALARCQRHPQEDRKACEDRVLGQGQTTQDGSVAGGGILRETVTPVTESPAPPASMPAPPPESSMPRPSPSMTE